MKDIGSLSYTKWECKYHVMFIPKYRRKVMYRELRHHLGKVFHDLARQQESRIEEGNLCVDHVHMLISMQSQTRSFPNIRFNLFLTFSCCNT